MSVRALANWASIVVAPVVFLANLSLMYALVPHACRAQSSAWLHVANGVTLALTMVALLLAWQALRGAAPATPGMPNDHVRWDCFLARVGLWISVIVAAAAALQWSAQLILSPCIA